MGPGSLLAPVSGPCSQVVWGSGQLSGGVPLPGAPPHVPASPGQHEGEWAFPTLGSNSPKWKRPERPPDEK